MTSQVIPPDEIERRNKEFSSRSYSTWDEMYMTMQTLEEATGQCFKARSSKSIKQRNNQYKIQLPLHAMGSYWTKMMRCTLWHRINPDIDHSCDFYVSAVANPIDEGSYIVKVSFHGQHNHACDIKMLPQYTQVKKRNQKTEGFKVLW